MTTLEYLEKLDNKSLRAKCVEYDLPNVPITDTSRKLLIRRLEAAMDGKPYTPSGKSKNNRRETIHVTNVQETTSNDHAKQNNEMEVKKSRSGSRKTMINMTTPSKEPSNTEKQSSTAAVHTAGSSFVQESVTPKRRSSRNSPAPITLSAPNSNVVSSTTNKKQPEIIEEIEEYNSGYDNDIMINENLKSPSRLDFRRESRSPSLSKSPIVTTSFVKEKVVESSIMDENIEEEEGFEEDNNDIGHYIPPEYENNLPSTAQHAPREYIIWPPQDRAKQSSSRRETFSQEGMNQFSYNTGSNYNPSSNSASGQQRGPSLTRTSVASFSLDGETSPVPSSRTSQFASTLNSYTSDLRKRDLSKEYFSTTETKPTNYSNQFTTSNLPNHNSVRREIYAEEQEDENIQTPYLSNYARRLSQLKAEPLQSAVHFKKEISQIRDNTHTNYISPRRNLQEIQRRNRNEKESVGESFRNLLIALDTQYNIKRKLLIVAVLALILLFIIFVR